MMVTNGHVAKGEKVLILGASGGVGVCCLQLAKLAGAEVIACAGTDAKAKRLTELGADKTINYIEKDFVKEVYAMYGKPTRRGAGTDQGVDVVVNYTGGDTWVKSLRVPEGRRPAADLRRHRGLRPEGGHPLHLDLRAARCWAPTAGCASDIEKLLELVQSGKLKVLVDKIFTLERGARGAARDRGPRSVRQDRGDAMSDKIDAADQGRAAGDARPFAVHRLPRAEGDRGRSGARSRSP